MGQETRHLYYCHDIDHKWPLWRGSVRTVHVVSRFHPVAVQTERYSLQDSRPVYLTLLAQDTSLSFWKEAVTMAILVKCISCCTNIVQKIALHVAKRCRQQFELEKVEMYCNIYCGYSFSRQQPLENTESENASFLYVYRRPLCFGVITGQNFASESLPSEMQVNTSCHQLPNCWTCSWVNLS